MAVGTFIDSVTGEVRQLVMPLLGKVKPNVCLSLTRLKGNAGLFWKDQSLILGNKIMPISPVHCSDFTTPINVFSGCAEVHCCEVDEINAEKLFQRTHC